MSARLVPASATGEGQPWWGINPDYIEADVVDYVLPDTFHQPSVVVYPVADYEAISDDVTSRIEGLRQLLADRPAAPDDIPFLPTFNAAQVFRAQVKYLDFQTGSGVRFLTLYAQFASPIDNYDLFYTFQGLTADGAHYVSVILPASAPYLADTSSPDAVVPEGGVPFPDYNAADFDAQYQDYMTAVTALINESSADAFGPSLDALDTVAASLLIE